MRVHKENGELHGEKTQTRVSVLYRIQRRKCVHGMCDVRILEIIKFTRSFGRGKATRVVSPWATSIPWRSTLTLAPALGENQTKHKQSNQQPIAPRAGYPFEGQGTRFVVVVSCQAGVGEDFAETQKKANNPNGVKRTFDVERRPWRFGTRKRMAVPQLCA